MYVPASISQPLRGAALSFTLLSGFGRCGRINGQGSTDGDVKRMPPQKKYPTSSTTSYTVGEVVFSETVSLSLGPNVFPTGSQILGRYLQLVRRDESGTASRRTAVDTVAIEVKDIWDKGNVPSRSVRSISITIDAMVTDFLTVNKFKKNRCIQNSK